MVDKVEFSSSQPPKPFSTFINPSKLHQLLFQTMGFFDKLFGTSEVSFDVKQLMQKGAVIVDVRTTGEFSGGHIKGSLNIPLDQIGTKIAFLKNKNVPVITVCRSGNRSGAAAGVLKSNGIEVYNGGAWDSLQSQLN